MNVTANPWTADSWNLTDQGAFIKAFGMAVAQRRMKEAGVKLGALRPAGLPQVSNKIYVIQGRPGRDGVSATATVADEILGFSGQGPFAPLERFDLAMFTHDVKFPGPNSASKSRATCIGAPASDFTCVLTDDLQSYLADGTHIICSVTFLAGRKVGSFVYPDPAVTIFAGTTPWLIMPDVPDPIFENTQIVFVGEPQ